MIWTIVGILIAIWLFGLVLDVVGGLIHIVLVLALVILAARFLRSRQTP